MAKSLRFHVKTRFNFIAMRLIESNIRAFVLQNLLNSLCKGDKMIGKPCILSLSSTRLVNSI